MRQQGRLGTPTAQVHAVKPQCQTVRQQVGLDVQVDGRPCPDGSGQAIIAGVVEQVQVGRQEIEDPGADTGVREERPAAVSCEQGRRAGGGVVVVGGANPGVDIEVKGQRGVPSGVDTRHSRPANVVVAVNGLALTVGQDLADQPVVEPVVGVEREVVIVGDAFADAQRELVVLLWIERAVALPEVHRVEPVDGRVQVVHAGPNDLPGILEAEVEPVG